MTLHDLHPARRNARRWQIAGACVAGIVLTIALLSTGVV